VGAEQCRARENLIEPGFKESNRARKFEREKERQEGTNRTSERASARDHEQVNTRKRDVEGGGVE